jgi:phospholipase A-2-activating protein
MPPIEQLMTIKGKKNGEVRLFKNGNKPEVYAWDSNENIWNKIGDVIGGSNKK